MQLPPSNIPPSGSPVKLPEQPSGQKPSSPIKPPVLPTEAQTPLAQHQVTLTGPTPAPTIDAQIKELEKNRTALQEKVKDLLGKKSLLTEESLLIYTENLRALDLTLQYLTPAVQQDYSKSLLLINTYNQFKAVCEIVLHQINDKFLGEYAPESVPSMQDKRELERARVQQLASPNLPNELGAIHTKIQTALTAIKHLGEDFEKEKYEEPSIPRFANAAAEILKQLASLMDAFYKQEMVPTQAAQLIPQQPNIAQTLPIPALLTARQEHEAAVQKFEAYKPGTFPIQNKEAHEQLVREYIALRTSLGNDLPYFESRLRNQVLILQGMTPPAAQPAPVQAMAGPEPQLILPPKIDIKHIYNIYPGSGIENAGNTCYLASVLQALRNCTRLREFLIKTPPHSIDENKYFAALATIQKCTQKIKELKKEGQKTIDENRNIVAERLKMRLLSFISEVESSAEPWPKDCVGDMRKDLIALGCPITTNQEEDANDVCNFILDRIHFETYGVAPTRQAHTIVVDKLEEAQSSIECLQAAKSSHIDNLQALFNPHRVHLKPEEETMFMMKLLRQPQYEADPLLQGLKSALKLPQRQMEELKKSPSVREFIQKQNLKTDEEILDAILKNDQLQHVESVRQCFSGLEGPAQQALTSLKEISFSHFALEGIVRTLSNEALLRRANESRNRIDIQEICPGDVPLTDADLPKLRQLKFFPPFTEEVHIDAEKPPKLLRVTLSRNLGGEKDFHPVAIPDKLKISGVDFRLKAACAHLGDDIANGHFVTFCPRWNPKGEVSHWLCYSDKTITEMNPQQAHEFLSLNGFGAFYEPEPFPKEF
jgi:hypothetical protein